MEMEVEEENANTGTCYGEASFPERAARMTVHLENLLVLRAQKADPSVNPCDDPNTAAIQTLTVLENVPCEVVRVCCSVLAYILKLRGGIAPQDFASPAELNAFELEQWTVLNGVRDFSHYMELCKTLVETVLENGRRVYQLFEQQKQNKEATAREAGQHANGEHRELNGAELDASDHQYASVNGGPDDTDQFDEDEGENELSLIHDLLRNMNGVFLRFYDLFVNGNGFPREKIYEKLFVSGCVSHREPMPLHRAHLHSLDSMFSMLAHRIIVSTDHCNTHFEAFFGTGILFTVLLNIITERFSSQDVESWSASALSATDHWTRVRLARPEDRQSIHFFKNTNSDSYRRAVARLPAHLFNATSGLDVYLTKGDTLCTMFVQFMGRVFLRTHEWPLRSDVFAHIKEHFVCDNLQRLFASIGRGEDQRAWIRFFKRNHDRSPRIYIQIEPLCSLNDELIGGESHNVAVESRPNEAALFGANAGKLRSNANADAARRYQQHRNFIDRYNEFMSNKNNELRDYWNIMRAVFMANSGGWDQNGGEANFTDSPLTDFVEWCRDINSLIFPYNFLLTSITAGAERANRLEEKTLDEAWILKCQEHLMARRFNSNRCKQILDFFKRLEIKSRLILEEKNFMYMFSEAMERMPFLYALFGDSLRDMENAQNEQNEEAF